MNGQLNNNDYISLNKRLFQVGNAQPEKQNYIFPIDKESSENEAAIFSLNNDFSLNECFQVYVRARPLNQKELAISNPKKRLNIIKKQENMVININIFILV